MAKTAKKAETTDLTVTPSLVIQPSETAVVGNFEELEKFLTKVRDGYKNVKMTTANMPDVLRVKAEMRTLRVNVEKVEKDEKQRRFIAPKKVMEGQFSKLYLIINEVEGRCDEVIAEEDQRRVDGVNQALDGYIEQFQGQPEYHLSDEYLARIDRKKAYYNKTQDEKDTVDDLRDQFASLAKAQKAEAGNIKLIKRACAKDARISENIFLSALRRGEDIASIIEQIEDEIERLANLDKAEKEDADEMELVAEPVDDYAGVVMPVRKVSLVEEAEGLDYISDLPERTKDVVVKITYPVDIGDTMTELFRMLHKHGVKSKIIK